MSAPDTTAGSAPGAPEPTSGANLPAKRPAPPAPARRKAMPSRFAEFLPDVEAVADRRHSPYARWVIITVAVLFGAFVTWASMAEVNQVATANGQVRPAGRVKVVNHSFGGTVADIMVDEGDLVESGDILLVLSAEFVDVERSGLRTQWLTLLSEVARLEAEATDAEPLFPNAVLDEAPNLAANQLDLLEARQSSLNSARAVAEATISQRQEAIASLEASLVGMRETLAIRERQVARYAELLSSGNYSQQDYDSALAFLVELRAGITAAESDMASARSSLNEATTQRAAVDEQWRADLLTELADARNRLDAVASQLQLSETEQAGLSITAPEAGIVQNLVVTNVGQSIVANEPLLNIVPVGDTLIVEASVANEDIGFIEIGMEAEVKVLTYDFITYGSLMGVVEEIAPDATVDQATGATYFKVWVRTERTYLGAEEGQFPVLPGMATMVDLQIGTRTILAFLTDRVTRTAQSAFTER